MGNGEEPAEVADADLRRDLDAASLATHPVRASLAREARVARLAALLVDLFVLGVITLVVNGVYGVTEVGSMHLAGNGTMTTSTTAVAWPWLVLLGITYFAVPEAMFGASPGKRVMGLRVVRADGRWLSIRDVVIRNVLKPVDFLPILYLLGGALVLATGAAQRLGDLAAGTTVVEARDAAEPGATRTADRRARTALALILAAAAVFTAGFDYFGRPPLVIEGEHNEGRFVVSGAQSYSLGAPAWGFGTVTYPLIARTDAQTCTGSITLRWTLYGWVDDAAQATCSPG
jgi:uncharacterized RDD family membrane protein YckC